jgi:hypothetical protein
MASRNATSPYFAGIIAIVALRTKASLTNISWGFLGPDALNPQIACAALIQARDFGVYPDTAVSGAVR